ncbi:MAG: hypothetical protein AAGI28_08805 [Pseudomonadota bacterium]
MEAPSAYIARWRPVLESGAKVKFAYGPSSPYTGNHCEIADDFVGTLALKQIGFNWELLDAGVPEGEPRSGKSELIKALTSDITNPSQPWLSPQVARDFAEGFLGLFEPTTLTLVSNRYDGLWNPIAGAATEWGFVGFDARHIVLLLLAD